MAALVAWLGVWPAGPAPAAVEEPAAPQAGAAGAAAEADKPLQAGTDVPAPKRTRLVLPEYPEPAKAQGVRGIVLLELIIERDGRVGDVRVLRSIPELDAAALEAVRQWEYEVTRVDGKPVRVRLAVPITFSMKLPELAREEGIPELRQGVGPTFPAGGGDAANVEADVTLDANGRVAEAVVTLGESPWAEALLRALRTWIFNWSDQTALLSFRLRAEFLRGRKGEEPHVSLAATGPRRHDVLAPGLPAEPAAPPAPAGPEAAPGEPPAAASAPVEPVAPGAQPAPGPTAEAPKAPASPAPEATPRPSDAVPKPPPAPPVEVIRVPPPRAEPPPGAGEPSAGAAAAPAPGPAPSDRPGSSSVQGVTLGVGVPDLTQGRRPLVPPFARMAGVTGTVEISFSVGASGATSTQSTAGPDLLKPAAEQMLASWVFRRTSTERLYLVASIEYGADLAKAAVTLVP